MPVTRGRGKTKVLLRAGLDGAVPREAFDRKKHGFVSPIGHWLRTDLAPYVEESVQLGRWREGTSSRGRCAGCGTPIAMGVQTLSTRSGCCSSWRSGIVTTTTWRATAATAIARQPAAICEATN